MPVIDVPELKTRRPLTPATPEFAVRSVTEPLVLAVPAPLSRLTKPPVCTVLLPASAPNRPPEPHIPLPTVRRSDPPRPKVAAALPMYRAPVLPLLEVPELITSRPLVPTPPAFAVRTVIEPLLVAGPSPLRKLIYPPVWTVLKPASTARPPPEPQVPPPTVISSEPPRPEVAAPLPMYKAPLLALIDVPELKTSRPLTPVLPEFAVRIVILPLLLAVPSPVSKLRKPPVCTVLTPARTPTRPADPLVPLPTVSNRAPPRPDVAAPLPTYKAPVLPVFEVPELKTRRPLTPLTPELAVRTVIDPLLV